MSPHWLSDTEIDDLKYAERNINGIMLYNNSWYWWDESERSCFGPHETVNLATDTRMDYFKRGL